MENSKSLKKSMQNSMGAIASSILTDIICSSLANDSYILKIIDLQPTFIPVNENRPIKIGIILLIFSVSWIMISVIIPLIVKFIKRFQFKKIIRHSPKYIASQFELRKKETLNLEKIFFNKDNTFNYNTALLNTKDLAIIITDIHKNFCPHNKQLKMLMKHNFRNHNHSTIINIANKISDYEFYSLINLLEKMVNSIFLLTTQNSLLKKDCLEMQGMLNELKRANKG